MEFKCVQAPSGYGEYMDKKWYIDASGHMSLKDEPGRLGNPVKSDLRWSFDGMYTWTFRAGNETWIFRDEDTMDDNAAVDIKAIGDTFAALMA